MFPHPDEETALNEHKEQVDPQHSQQKAPMQSEGMGRPLHYNLHFILLRFMASLLDLSHVHVSSTSLLYFLTFCSAFLQQWAQFGNLKNAISECNKHCHCSVACC